MIFLENVINTSTTESVQSAKNEGLFHREAFVCVPNAMDPEVDRILAIGRHAMPIMYAISLVFLLLAFIHIYIKNRNRLFGAMTLALIAMLTGFYICILIPHVAGASHIHEEPILCQLEGFGIQFFYISAMFWLNSMCIDIWCTFRRLRIRARVLKSLSANKQLTKGK